VGPTRRDVELNLQSARKYVRTILPSAGPEFIDVELTNRCNLHCAACWFHGERGVGDRYGDAEMSTTQVLSLIDQAAPHRPAIYLGGGEPFMRQDLPDIIEHASRLGLPVSLTTNGTLVDAEAARMLVELGLKDIRFSIDGPEEVHDALRGPGVFSRVIANLHRLARYKRQTGSDRPHLSVNLLLTPLTMADVEAAMEQVRTAVGEDVECIVLHHPWFITPAELASHQREVKKALGRAGAGARAHCVSWGDSVDAKALSEQIARLADRPGIGFFPNMRGEAVERFYSEGYEPKLACTMPFRGVVVKPNGDVRFCPDEWIDDYVLGNVLQKPLDEIWKGRAAKRFRWVLLRKGPFPGCKRCSWIHLT
jgi:radical SAM protein with 4Fe4S-binding SPASM domain